MKVKPFFFKLLYGFCALLLIWGCTGGKPQKAQVSVPEAESLPRDLGAVTLPLPDVASIRDYLGVTADPFALTEIKARLLVVEAFSMYCPHCQREAPLVNRLYRMIQDKGVGEQIKIIGIGVGNTNFEVETFRKTYQVPFPLFADEKMDLARRMEVKRTPTFLALRMDETADLRVVLFHPGRMETVESFLKKLTDLAGDGSSNSP